MPATTFLTVDVEDWCQSSSDLLPPPGEAIQRPVPPSPRVVDNSLRLLEILAAHGAQATCFVLATVAESFPQLVREIHGAGHEIASHGYGHDPVYRLDRERFRLDVERSLAILEDVTGTPVRGYRAPYFSITADVLWALDVLAELGLEYDSSTYPIARGLYGFYPGWRGGLKQRFPHRLELAGGASLLELPCSTVRLGPLNLPAGGGGTLRWVPARLAESALRSVRRDGWPALFYLHPFDLDADELAKALPGEPLRRRALRRLINFNRRGNEAKLDYLARQLSFVSIRKWLDEEASYLS